MQHFILTVLEERHFGDTFHVTFIMSEFPDTSDVEDGEKSKWTLYNTC